MMIEKLLIKKTKGYIFFAFLIVLNFCVVIDAFVQTPARNLIGTQNGKSIRLQTFNINSAEYIQASDLMQYFENQWDYNPLIGTIRLTRDDGTRIGLTLNDQRILEGSIIHYAGNSPIRDDGVVFIPFTMVYPYLFPQVSFQTDNNVQVANDATPTPYSQSSFIFTLPTPTPIMILGTPVPTFSPYPTPTPYQMSTSDDQPRIRRVNIILDPGHSKEDQGALAPNGKYEEAITLVICQKIQSALTRQGDHFQVTLTRSSDFNQALSPDQRGIIANNQQADLFISIHCGGLSSDDISRGAVFFMSNKLDLPLDRDIQRLAAMHNVKAWQESYYDNQVLSRKLASHVNQQLRRLYTITNIIQIDSNPRPGRFHLLRGLTMPGILIELGNLHHPTSANYFNSERHQDDLANYIADAIVNYIYEQQTVYQ